MHALDFHISTNDVSPRDALSYWNDYVCNTLIELDVLNSTKKQDFFASLDVHQMDDVQICKIISRNNSVRRTSQQIAKSTEGYFIINFQLTGESLLKQDGRSVFLKPNDWTFTDSTRPYELDFRNEFEQLVLKIPRSLITYGTSYITANTALLLDENGGLGKIVKSYILALNNEIDKVNVYTRKHLASTLIQLLNDYFNSKFVTNKSNTPSKEMMLLRIKSFVEEEVSNPQLSIQQIANKFNCSKRQLHTIFSNESYTLNNYIRDFRLKKCRIDIENFALLKLTIAEIGYKNGFNDCSTFVKLFKQKFGAPPGEYRNLYAQSCNTNTFRIST